MMKLKFDPSLDYQHTAVSAIADLFEGQATGTVETETGAVITDGLIQTGTGKTYVYLRSAFELASRYGFRKFIIVVPSVAIREGVLKSLEVMGEHFRGLYDAMPFNFDVYDSKRPSRVRQFAGGQHLQFLVMNIQAFINDAGEGETSGNIIYRDSDKMGGRPIDFLSQTNPIVIIDEPQRMDTNNAAAAIKRLNPAAIFRYSATHKDTRNLLFRLGPVEAFERQLVKRIEVDIRCLCEVPQRRSYQIPDHRPDRDFQDAGGRTEARQGDGEKRRYAFPEVQGTSELHGPDGLGHRCHPRRRGTLLPEWPQALAQ
jgi:type III restriction enzyme